MERPIVHVVDDDNALRESILRLLQAADLEARGYGSTGEFLLQRPIDGHGCLLLDVLLPGPSGIELFEVLNAQGIALPVVIMTGHADIAACAAIMRAGAVDYLVKPVEPTILLAAVHEALALDRRRRALQRQRLELQTLFSTLSPREMQVFEMIASGRLNKQIATDLGIAERTVKAQRASLMAKLQVTSAAELGRFAERLSLVSEGATGPHRPAQ